MTNIGIIGTGHLGTRLAEQLVMDSTCEKVLLSNRSAAKLRGTLLSLKLWANLRQTKTEVEELDFDALDAVNVVVIAVKERYDPRSLARRGLRPAGVPEDLRHIGIRKDLPQVQSVCRLLQRYRGIVAVVTNPVDIMTSYVSRWLPKATVVGLGVSVDAARLAYILSEELKKRITRIECPLGGEHGGNLVPIRTLWNGSLLDQLAAHPECAAEILKAERIGPAIVEDLGYTVHDCAVVFAEDIAWLSAGCDDSMGTVSIWDETASIGWPVRFRKGSLIKVRSLGKRESRLVRDARDRVAAYLQALGS
jgi:malate/lactate dehydrogenase